MVMVLIVAVADDIGGSEIMAGVVATVAVVIFYRLVLVQFLQGLHPIEDRAMNFFNAEYNCNDKVNLISR